MAKQIKAKVGEVNLTCDSCENCKMKQRCENNDFKPTFDADDDFVYCSSYGWNGLGIAHDR